MSYERYKDFRLAPDDNGCWDVLDKDYQQQLTFPSKAAAKRWIDSEVATPVEVVDNLDTLLIKTDFKGNVLMVAKYYSETQKFGWTPLKAQLTSLINQTVSKELEGLPRVSNFVWYQDVSDRIEFYRGKENE